MKPTETVQLMKLIRAMCPAQKIDDYTPDAWHHALAPLDLADVITATQRAGARQPFVALCDVVQGVEAIRRARLDATPAAALVPTGDPDDTRAWQDELAARRRRAAAPSTPPEVNA